MLKRRTEFFQLKVIKITRTEPKRCTASLHKTVQMQPTSLQHFQTNMITNALTSELSKQASLSSTEPEPPAQLSTEKPAKVV